MHYSFKDLFDELRMEMKSSKVVKPTRWQGRTIVDKPDMQTYEILNRSDTIWLPDENLQGYRDDLQPDTPWADEHFEERVGRYPLNPGHQWKKWRKEADSFRDPDGRFNHNYMERYWPKLARQVDPSEFPDEIPPGLKPHRGILYEYGDLDDIIKLLAREPLTRQAYFPVWFPEDTGVVHRGRAPCTLGYHFICRDRQLHVVYYLRSCDLINHWHNDMYFTVRLLIWALEELRKLDSEFWGDIGPGTLTTHITSLHCFRGEFHKL